MKRICGIELKSSHAVLVVLDCHNDSDGEGDSKGKSAEFIELAQRKIELEDDESVACMTEFHTAITTFIQSHNIEQVVVKKRAKKGTMAGGAISFKMEAIIQLNGTVEVELITGQAIAAADKKQTFERPANLKKYQEAAFLAASLSHRRSMK
jgi:hypothetical protein